MFTVASPNFTAGFGRLISHMLHMYRYCKYRNCRIPPASQAIHSPGTVHLDLNTKTQQCGKPTPRLTTASNTARKQHRCRRSWRYALRDIQRDLTLSGCDEFRGIAKESHRVKCKNSSTGRGMPTLAGRRRLSQSWRCLGCQGGQQGKPEGPCR